MLRRSIVDRFALAALCLAGCAPRETDPVAALVAVDLSDPAEEVVLRHADAAHRFQRRLPSGSRVRVYVFAHRVEAVYDGPPLRSRDAFNEALGRSLREPSPNIAAHGTRTELVLDRLALDAAESDLRLRALIVTDGGVEDRSKETMARFHDAVRSLASRKDDTALLVVGVEPRFRVWWEDLLAPLGPNARVRGTNDWKPLVEGGLR